MESPTQQQHFCTLFEGDYHHGVAALINSLVAAGFSGTFWAGYRGALPRWAVGDSIQVKEMTVRLVKLDTPVMFSQYKPHWMRRILEIEEPSASSIVYFDPDIVWGCEREFLSTWMDGGVAVCRDLVLQDLPPSHVLRRAWSAYAQGLGLRVSPGFERQYFNGGFVGVHRDAIRFLHCWQELMDRLHEAGVPLDQMKSFSRRNPFNVPDQDAMNIACMIMPEVVRSLGLEGMGFQDGMEVMWHAVENPKPWRRSFVLDLLRTGRAVPQAHRQYWKYAAGPVRSWSRARYLIKRVDLSAAIVLSRFYHSA